MDWLSAQQKRKINDQVMLVAFRALLFARTFHLL
jgi:hypothetical protein